jgi:integrase/recombinase XerD
MRHTGLRVSEVCNLRRKDVLVNKRSGHLRVWGKRNKYREVPLNATVRRALCDYLESEKQDICLFASRRTKSRLIPRGIGFLITKYARHARIASLRPHDLRLSFGYRMAEQVPLHRLAQIMGHDSLDTTMIYIAGTRKDLQQAVETIAWE